MKRSKRPLWAIASVAALLFPIGQVFGQQSTSTSVNWAGYWYPGSSVRTAAVMPRGTLSNQYNINGSPSSCSTAGGTMSVGSSFYQANGTTQVNVTITPNGYDGSFSGSCAFKYSNTTNSSNPLTLTVSYTGSVQTPTATAEPKYQVLSILYTPPGNASSSQFSNAVSAGSTVGLTQNFSTSDTVTFSAGFLFAGSSVSFTTGASQGSTSQYQTTYQGTGSAQLKGIAQKIDHTQDQVFLLIDPTYKVTQTASTTGYYQIGPSLHATGSFSNGQVPSDVINVNIAGLKNPSLIPLSVLEPQVVQPGTTLPGLSFVCANPLPVNQCTQANACGCVASDFQAIVNQDELANDTVDATPLNSIDSSRFVFVTDELLQGPQQSGAAPVTNAYSLSDSSVSSQSTSSGTSYTVGVSKSFGSTQTADMSLGFSGSSSTSFTISQTQTAGASNGTAHTAMVTLGTSDPGCQEYVDVYEDTTYHTFAYSLAQTAPSTCQ